MLTVAHMSLQAAGTASPAEATQSRIGRRRPRDETRPSADAAYYSVSDVAERLRVTPRTVYELLASGQLRSVRIRRASGRLGVHRIPSDYLAEYEAQLRA